MFLVFLAAVGILGGQLSSSMAQAPIDYPWCNVYAPTSFSADENRKNRLMQIKYGKLSETQDLDLAQALMWWAAYMLSPGLARDQKVMHFVPISQLNAESLGRLIAVAGNSGKSQPLVVFAARPDTAENVGAIQSATSTPPGGLITTPVSWSGQFSESLKRAASLIDDNPDETRRKIAKVAAFVLGISMDYDPTSIHCAPLENLSVTATSDAWDAVHVTDADLADIYIGVHQPIVPGDKLVRPVRALVEKSSWPTQSFYTSRRF